MNQPRLTSPLRLGGGLFRAGSAIVAVSIAGKIFAFARDVVCAQQFGVTRTTDVYFFVFNVWVVFCVALAASVSSLSVPAITARITERGQAAGEGLVRSLVVEAIALFGVTALSIWMLAPRLVQWLFPTLLASDRELAESLFRVTAVLLPLLVGSAVLGSLMRVRGRFGWAELPLALTNAGALVGIGAGASAAGLVSLAWGMSAGALVGVFALVAAAGLRVRGRGDVGIARGEGLRLYGRALGLTLVGHSGGYASGFLENLFTIRLPAGDLSILAYSRRFLLLLPQIVLPAVLTPGLSEMAHASQSRHPNEANRLATDVAKALLLVITPVIAVCVALAIPLIDLLFGRGRFDSAHVGMTALVAASLGMIPILSILRNVYANRLLAAGFSAQPILAGVAGVTAFGITAALAWRTLGLWGVIVAQYAADLTGLVVVAASARRKCGSKVLSLLVYAGKVVAAGVMASATGYAVYSTCRPVDSDGGFLTIGVMLLAAVGSFAAYLATTRILKVSSLARIWRELSVGGERFLSAEESGDDPLSGPRG